MKNKRENKIHRDKNGREFIKETYFVDGKMKFHRIYVIDGLPTDELYKKNATDFDFYMNGDYDLISSEEESNTHCNEQDNKELDSIDNEDLKNIPF